MKNLRLLVTLIFVVALLAACSKQSSDESAVPKNDLNTETQNTETQNTETMADEGTTTQNDAGATANDTKSKPADEGKTAEKKVADTKQKPKQEKPEVYTPPPTKTVSLPESTLVAITLVDSIDTDINVTGQNFTAELKDPIVADGETVFQRGDKVKGVLNKVVESGHLKTPAELSFSIVSITNSKGEEYTIDTYPISEKKDSHTKKEVGLIGGGAVVGGVIGKLTGKKGGTEIGAAAGAAAGTAAAAASGKKDIVHSAGTDVVFALRTPLKITVTTGGPYTKK